jgi:hypothetical protein
MTTYEILELIDRVDLCLTNNWAVDANDIHQLTEIAIKYLQLCASTTSK